MPNTFPTFHDYLFRIFTFKCPTFVDIAKEVRWFPPR